MTPNNRNEEERIQRLMEELPLSMQTPNEFKSKLIDSALDANKKARPVRRPLWVGAMTAGIAAVALGAYFMSPKPAAAKTWSMVRQAVEKVTSFRLTISETVGGKRQEEAVIAFSDQGMMIQADSEIIYMDGKTMQVYDPKENTVVRMKVGGFESELQKGMAEGLSEGLGALSLKDIIADVEKEYGKENIKIGPIRTENGRQVYDVYLRDPKDGTQATLTVDAGSDRPIKILNEEIEHGAKKLTEIKVEYNGKWDIKPNFPADAKYEDIDLTKMISDGMKMDSGSASGSSQGKGGGSFKFEFGDKGKN